MKEAGEKYSPKEGLSTVDKPSIEPEEHIKRRGSMVMLSQFEKQRIVDEANVKRSEASNSRQRKDDGTFDIGPVVAKVVQPLDKPRAGEVMVFPQVVEEPKKQDRTTSKAKADLIWKDCSEQGDAWQAEKQRIVDEANTKRSEATKEQHLVSNPRASEIMVAPQVVAAPDSKRSKTNETKAKSSKTNRGTVERMDSCSGPII